MFTAWVKPHAAWMACSSDMMLTRDVVACLSKVMWRDVNEIVGVCENCQEKKWSTTSIPEQWPRAVQLDSNWRGWYSLSRDCRHLPTTSTLVSWFPSILQADMQIEDEYVGPPHEHQHTRTHTTEQSCTLSRLNWPHHSTGIICSASSTLVIASHMYTQVRTSHMHTLTTVFSGSLILATGWMAEMRCCC